MIKWLRKLDLNNTRLQNTWGNNMTEILTMKDRNGKDFRVGMKLRSHMFPKNVVTCVEIKDGKAHLLKHKKEMPIILNQETLALAQWEVPSV